MSFHLKPDEVVGLAKQAYGVADDVGRLDVDGVLRTASSGCAGTGLATGLQRHATTQHEHVQQLARDLDDFGQNIVGAVDAFVRLDGDAPTSAADHDA